MKSSISVLLAAATTAAFVSTADAVPAYGDPGKSPVAYPMDCARAKDKTRCEALNKDIAACKNKTDDEWRECMRRPAPAASVAPPKQRDCTKARNQERCEAHNAALDACKDKTTRAAHRKCMAGQLPASGAR
ncbi:MAG: hypothetical protein D4R74_14230 [Betaproteobacteria bacterium]|nr:MAG: hypothetical protein D4R74_14230 [Betaproteobacteria bacterium]